MDDLQALAITIARQQRAILQLEAMLETANERIEKLEGGSDGEGKG